MAENYEDMSWSGKFRSSYLNFLSLLCKVPSHVFLWGSMTFLLIKILISCRGKRAASKVAR